MNQIVFFNYSYVANEHRHTAPIVTNSTLAYCVVIVHNNGILMIVARLF